MRTILITGAAGQIGTVLSENLEIDGWSLRLLDRVPTPSTKWPDSVACDLNDAAAIRSAMEGVDCVIHLAGIPQEAPFDELLEDNIRGTYNVFEAARSSGVKRVVFASTNHVVGFHPTAIALDEHVESRPDTLYGASKVFGEALGRLFHDKYGLEVLSIRIGSFRQRPTSLRELSTWLSPGDAVRLFEACVTAHDVGYRVVYGVSANTRVKWTDRTARLIGYVPINDAETFASEIDQHAPSDEFHGGAYTEPDHTGGF